ncbi:hypothetical protein CI109_103973 [Kwoniella shandongensis]|uniref:Uncharacterized protein n=1 Tax=Kwoniella shandongensis TaxID=1734106 RepID=A0A5M6BXP3_9TREE|nr:uncharacterized protein CI109_004143 [Kwoniella shandongensis]KAA5527604.1 hypothetical protein CI109_004143 [Kwoniella shandongensis]
MPRNAMRKFTRSPALLLLFIVLHGVRGQYLPSEEYTRRGSKLGSRQWTNDTENIIKRDGNQDSTSTSLYLVSHDDFCLYGPADPGTTIAESQLKVVSWCTKDSHGTRLMPDGTLNGVTYVKAPNWVQVSGTGHFTNINVQSGDAGGQFDSDQHKPDGGQMFISDDNQSASSWVTLISDETFCVRACTGDPKYCPTDYDEMGCYFYTSNGIGWDGVYQDCEADDGDPPGVVDGTTYTQGNSPIPTPTIPAVSNCNPGPSVANGQTAPAGGFTAGSSSDDGGSSDSGSTSWVPVQTCIPCTATASSGASSQGNGGGGGSVTPTPTSTSSPASSASSASGATEQVGITQHSSSASSSSNKSATSSTQSAGSVSYTDTQSGLNGHGAEVVQSSTTSPTSSAAAAAAAADDLSNRGWLIDRRDDEGTTTSNGQCCFTTWTPSVIGGGGGAQETGTPSGKAGTSSSSASSGTKIASSTTGAGSHPFTASTNGTGVVSASVASGTLRSGNVSVGGNSSSAGNGTNGTSAGMKVTVVGLREGGMTGLVWVSLVTGLGMVFGGVALV